MGNEQQVWYHKRRNNVPEKYVINARVATSGNDNCWREVCASQFANPLAITPGKLVKWLDDKGSLTDSVIFESREGNLGIGTSAPIASLEARRLTESYGSSAIVGATFGDSTTFAVPPRIRAGVSGIGTHNFSASSV